MEGFYRGLPALPGPSPFALHVAAALDAPAVVVDLGCGDGRDAAHFAHLGHRTLGLDGCAAAIARARSRATKARFAVATLAEGGPLVSAHLLAAPDALVYARFLLHALTATEAARLLADLAATLRPGARLALEYRTLADAALPKRHAPHFRRFVDHAALEAELRGHNFEILEAAEAQGLSPFNGEDPVLGRILARRA